MSFACSQNEYHEENLPAWLMMAVGCVDKICCTSASYTGGQVDNEMLEEECIVRNDAYWKTVEEALSAKESEDDDSQQQDDIHRNRVSVDAFMPAIEEREREEESSTGCPPTQKVEPLVLAPATPPITNSKHTQFMSISGTTKFVMDMPNELMVRDRRHSRMRSLMIPSRRKCRSMFARSKVLDYHSLGSSGSFQRRSRLLADTDEASLTSLSTAMSTEGELSLTNTRSSSQSMDVLSQTRSANIKRRESRLEAKLRAGTHTCTSTSKSHRPSLRDIMDESVQSLPYLTMSQGYEV